MELKNYQEDVVLGLLEVLLADEPEYLNDQRFKYDVAAYTLNRIRPKYFMSERGFTRFADLYLSDDENPDGFANLVELAVLINHAIDTIKLRRSGYANDQRATTEPKEPVAEYVHNFPHIIGRAVDQTTRQPVAEATVTLFRGETPVDSIGPGWPNPYRTSAQGKGYFSFWPKCVLNQKLTIEHTFDVRIVHEQYEPIEIKLDVATKGAFERQEVIRNDSIITLDTCLLGSRR